MAVSEPFTEAELDECVTLLRRYFVDEDSLFHERQRSRQGFPLQKRRLTCRDLQAHLRGEKWIAVRRAAESRVVALDLDCKGEPTRYGRMVDTYWLIRRIIVPAPLVVRSSDSRGLHLYWFLVDAANSGCLVRRLGDFLAEHNVQVRNGICEVKPTTRLALRLPFGAESTLETRMRKRGVSRAQCARAEA